MIPQRVRDAARQIVADGHSDPVPSRKEPRIGQIAKLESYPDHEGRIISRLGLVVGVDPADQTARILLATPSKEFATDLDLVVPTLVSGLPYDLLVQAELYGTVFEEQVVATLATIDREVAAAADAALATDGESLQEISESQGTEAGWTDAPMAYETGWPLGSSNDPRRTFKELELDELDALVRECRRAMDGLAADEGILDPSLLVPPPAGTDPDVAADRFLEMLDLVNELGTGKIEMPAYWLEDEALLGELKRWQSEFGLPAARILDRYILTTEDPVDPLTDNESIATSADPRVGADVVLRKALRSMGRTGSAVVDIYTTPFEWHRRHDPRFIREAAGSNAFVRAFPRTLETTHA